MRNSVGDGKAYGPKKFPDGLALVRKPPPRTLALAPAASSSALRISEVQTSGGSARCISILRTWTQTPVRRALNTTTTATSSDFSSCRLRVCDREVQGALVVRLPGQVRFLIVSG